MDVTGATQLIFYLKGQFDKLTPTVFTAEIVKVVHRRSIKLEIIFLVV